MLTKWETNHHSHVPYLSLFLWNEWFQPWQSLSPKAESRRDRPLRFLTQKIQPLLLARTSQETTTMANGRLDSLIHAILPLLSGGWDFVATHASWGKSCNALVSIHSVARCKSQMPTKIRTLAPLCQSFASFAPLSTFCALLCSFMS
jgi:hypothetical protein